MIRLLVYILCPLLIAGSQGCAPVTVSQFLDDGKKPLSSKELQEQFTGTTLHLEAHDFDGRVQLLPDGYLTSSNIQKDTDKGRWKITDDNQLCFKFDRWYFGDLNCYQLINDGKKYIFFTANGARYFTAKILSTGNSLEQAGSSPGKSPARATDQSARLNNDTRATVSPLTGAEKRQTLITVARNCPGCNLAGVNLADAQLVAADLAGANLQGAIRRPERAWISLAILLYLAGANLTNTNLSGANLTGCDFSNSDLSGANLIRATANGANFEGAELDGSHLESIQGLKY